VLQIVAMEEFNLPPHVREIFESLKVEPIIPVELTPVFDMTIAMFNALIPCSVFFARAEGDMTFTRVLLYPGTALQSLIDVDKVEDEWMDVYLCQATPMSEIVGAALDFHIREQNKA
jgi:hypothetical protein